jgi:hypothetical protein
MIKLKPFIVKILLEAMSPAQANSIFSKYGVKNAASLDTNTLKREWLKLVKQYHTDISDKDPNALKDINAAYDVLKTRSSAPSDFHNDFQTHSSARDLWQPDDRAMPDPNPKKPNINYYLKLAWEISGKPHTKYTFWNWDGQHFRGSFTVYTNLLHWFEVSKLLVEWDNHFESRAVFVSDPRESNVIYLINHRGNRVRPPKKFEHESFNRNPGNDRAFERRLEKEL